MTRAQVDLSLVDKLRRPSSAIQVTRQGASRLPNQQEARALALGALWTLEQTAGGIRLANGNDESGVPLALVVIENARFDRDSRGYSTLKAAEPGKENQ